MREEVQQIGMDVDISRESQSPDFRKLTSDNYIAFTAPNNNGETQYINISIVAQTQTDNLVRSLTLQCFRRSVNTHPDISLSFGIIEPNKKINYGKIQRKFERAINKTLKESGVVKTDSVRRREFFGRIGKIGAGAIGTLTLAGSAAGIASYLEQNPQQNPFAPQLTPTPEPTATPSPTPEPTPHPSPTPIRRDTPTPHK